MIGSTPAKIGAIDTVGTIDQIFSPEKAVKKRVILLQGCAQRAIAPEINAATLRLLSGLGVEVVVREMASCCGGLAHHINETDSAHHHISATARAWRSDIDAGNLDAIIVNTSGCGTTLKDYGQLLSADHELAETGARISALAMDITEFLAEHTQLPALPGKGAFCCLSCSLFPATWAESNDRSKTLLTTAGFEVRQIADPFMLRVCRGV